MATIRFVPNDQEIHVRDGMTILEAARRANVMIRTRCGGRAACLMCKIRLEDREDHTPLPKPNDKERRKLGASVDQGFRLACQTTCHGTLKVFVPEDPLQAAIRKQLERKKEGGDDDF